MVIALFGDSCTGKSTVAEKLAQRLSAEIYSGNGYLKLAKSESTAAALFKKKLCGDGVFIYVISEKEQLALLPEKCVRVLVTADIETIKKRFAERMHGSLPVAVASMLERKYGQFESEPYEMRINTEDVSAEKAAEMIMAFIGK